MNQTEIENSLKEDSLKEDKSLPPEVWKAGGHILMAVISLIKSGKTWWSRLKNAESIIQEHTRQLVRQQAEIDDLKSKLRK